MLTQTPPPGPGRDDDRAHQVEPGPGDLIAVGVRAQWWADQCGQPRETPLRFAGDWTAEDIARYATTEHLDDGCVDWWPAVAGQVEVRTPGGTVIAVYRGGRRFGPEVGRL